jgi:hypothetical protein
MAVGFACQQYFIYAGGMDNQIIGGVLFFFNRKRYSVSLFPQISDKDVTRQTVFFRAAFCKT